jgi:hypothetical protein
MHFLVSQHLFGIFGICVERLKTIITPTRRWPPESFFLDCVLTAKGGEKH